MEKEHKSLLERYGIPINHLDFQYIKTCTNIRELEKIVTILRSNEEGYYPDLTKCAEDKLRELHPDSSSLRFEEPIKTTACLSAEELKPFLDMTKDLKKKDCTLEKLSQDENFKNDLLDQVPIRKGGKIDKPEEEKKKEEKKSTPSCSNISNNPRRIKSTDYRKWDQYDADAEVLKIELDQERKQEELEIKTRINQKKYSKPKIEEITNDDKENEIFKKLSSLEKEKLSENYRLRGNDYFRERNFQMALDEYTQAIKFCPAGGATAYSNRAAAYMKLEKYEEAIEDCTECLKIEPENVKALVRMAESKIQLDQKSQAREIFQKVLSLDAKNSVALSSLGKLNKELGELPPANATRLKIEESKDLGKKATAPKPKKKPKEEIKYYDLAELVKPNKIINKAPEAPSVVPESQAKPKSNPKTKAPISKVSDQFEKPFLQLPSNAKKPFTRTLIEEIN